MIITHDVGRHQQGSGVWPGTSLQQYAHAQGPAQAHTHTNLPSITSSKRRTTLAAWEPSHHKTRLTDSDVEQVSRGEGALVGGIDVGQQAAGSICGMTRLHPDAAGGVEAIRKVEQEGCGTNANRPRSDTRTGTQSVGCSTSISFLCVVLL